jgi:hypothetical protein
MGNQGNMVQLSVEALGLSIFQSPQTSSGNTRPSIKRTLRAFPPGIKRPEREADHLPPSSPLRMSEARILLPHMPSWHAQEHLYFTTNINANEKFCLVFRMLLYL